VSVTHQMQALAPQGAAGRSAFAGYLCVSSPQMQHVATVDSSRSTCASSQGSSSDYSGSSDDLCMGGIRLTMAMDMWHWSRVRGALEVNETKCRKWL
jgi:hypothetical protein